MLIMSTVYQVHTTESQVHCGDREKYPQSLNVIVGIGNLLCDSF